MTNTKYKVFVDDNFNFMDENERYADGVYNTYEAAVAKCKRIVDEFLEDAYEPGMTADQLYYGTYTMFGEDPFIVGSKQGAYSSWEYAEQRCKELTAKNNNGNERKEL
jgi:hypothetical protein